MSTRGLIVCLVLVIVAGLLIGWALRSPAPRPIPSDPPTPLPVATPDPDPGWIEDNDLPPLPEARIPVCHCIPAYGACVDQLMVREAARLHAIRHSHDLIGRGCASATEEERALRRVLFRPELVEMNSRETLSMADRAALRERMR